MGKRENFVSNEDVGRRIRMLRKRRKLTQEQLAEVLSVSRNAVWDFENGAYGMSQDVLYRMKNFFQVSSDYILYGEQANPNDDAFMLLEMASDIDKMRILMHLLSYFVSVKETGSMSDTNMIQAVNDIQRVFGSNGR